MLMDLETVLDVEELRHIKLSEYELSMDIKSWVQTQWVTRWVMKIDQKVCLCIVFISYKLTKIKALQE